MVVVVEVVDDVLDHNFEKNPPLPALASPLPEPEIELELELELASV